MTEPYIYRAATDDEVDLAYRHDTKVRASLVVPVEPCEHGNIDPHIVFYTDGTPWHGCPGAGIGGDE